MSRLKIYGRELWVLREMKWAYDGRVLASSDMYVPAWV
jgi:hypothetical protein